MMWNPTYEGVRRAIYLHPEHGDAVFVPVCRECRRFVKADASVRFNSNGPQEPNATCAKCGPTTMLFEGWF